MPNSNSNDSGHLLLRNEIRQRRQALSPNQQESAAARLSEFILRDPDYLAASKVAFYLAFDGEISPELILKHACEQGKTCYLPVLDQEQPVLSFVEYQRQTALQNNRFGIAEPRFEKHKSIAPDRLDIIFMPLVAFDLHGSRLGMGKGYYDRALAGFLDNSLTAKPLLVGLAHECQRVVELERADWDVPLDRIVTDQAVYPIKA